MSPYEYTIEDLQKVLSDNGQKLVLFNLPAGNWATGDCGIAIDPARKPGMPCFSSVWRLPCAENGRGTGEINYRWLLVDFDAAGCTGYVGLEYLPISDSDSSFRWIGDYGFSL